MQPARRLRIRQLDEKLEPFAMLRSMRLPSEGWAKAIRETLGISVRQMARLTGRSRTSVTSAEQGEARGSVQMTTLEGLAEALDCDLVYALAPRRSLARTLESQARRKAEHLLGRVDDSMRLEAQSVDADEMSKQVEELAEDLLRERGHDFWDL